MNRSSNSMVPDSSSRGLATAKYNLQQRIQDMPGQNDGRDLNEMLSERAKVDRSNTQTRHVGLLIRKAIETKIDANGGTVPSDTAQLMEATMETVMQNASSHRNKIQADMKAAIDSKKIVETIIETMKDDDANTTTVYNAVWGIFKQVLKATGMLSESQLNSCTLLQAMVPESLFGVKLQHPLIMSALDDEMREISDTEGDKVSDILGWQRLQSILNQCERALKSPETTRFQAQELFSKCVGKPRLYGDGSSAEQMKRERVKLRWLPTALLGSSYYH